MFNNFRKTGRIEAIDLIKLFAAFLVICSHCMDKYITSSTSNPIYNFIWLTQMTLFIFASGYVNSKPEKVLNLKMYFKRLLKNVLSLLVPCLTYLLITCLIHKRSVISSFVLFYLDPQTNLWFLWVLFAIHLFFDFGLYLSNKFNNKSKTAVPVAILLFVSLLIVVLMFAAKGTFDFNILSMKLFAYYVPFYCFGFLSHFIVNSELMNKKSMKIASIVIASISFAVVLFECIYFKSIYSFDDSNIKYLLFRIVGSIASIIVCVFVSDLLVNLKFFASLSKYGAFSLQSYYIHIIIIKYLSYSSDLVWAQWLIAFGTALLLIIMTGVTIVIIYFVPYLHLILFGKSFSFYKIERKLPEIFRR